MDIEKLWKILAGIGIIGMVISFLWVAKLCAGRCDLETIFMTTLGIQNYFAGVNSPAFVFLISFGLLAVGVIMKLAKKQTV